MASPHSEQISEWLQTLKSTKSQADQDDPNYWTSNPASLITEAQIENISFGTGETLYKNIILPAILAAEQEVILVTCFWARSPTLDALNETLIALSERALQQGAKVRVRICFSSLSVWQKLFHTSSLEGQVYPSQQWRGKLGLPAPERLEGLDIEVKSIFVLPFSVMHPKFVVVDRQRVFLPSCNVSWEQWFEGCVTLSGKGVVGQFVRFWEEFWARGEGKKVMAVDDDGEGLGREDGDGEVVQKPTGQKYQDSFCWSIEQLQQKNGWTKLLFLPSPHHRNPRFALLPWRACPPPPPTPLNTFVLSAIRNAKKQIYIQTPNLTAPPVLSALLEALRNGVSVDIVTSERLMILEQLVTAGTTTKRCINKVVKRHKALLQHYRSQSADEELVATQPGRLRMFFFQPNRSDSGGGDQEPTQSHLKFMKIDDEWTVFGSGNMDRASWYTSQELGVAFEPMNNDNGAGTRIATEVHSHLSHIMATRRKLYYDGS